MSRSHHKCIGDIAGCNRKCCNAFVRLCSFCALDSGRHVTPPTSLFSKTLTSSQSRVPSAHTAASSSAGGRVASANGSVSSDESFGFLDAPDDAPDAPTRRSETPKEQIHRANRVASN
jgi:hypothetical protein